MGGNAVKNVTRLGKKDFLEVSTDIISRLREIGYELEPVKFYASKNTFGDLDLVVKKPKLSREEFTFFLDSIGSRDVFYNKDMISFEYRNFQIDLIFVAPEFFGTALFYYSYNDLNNLVGRIAHKLGLKFGWDGLTYAIRTEAGHKSRKISLSTCPEEIYTFLGLDYKRWRKGFNTLEEIFHYVTSSPYFSPSIYQYQALNHRNRTRNRKRQTYRQFLTWLEEQEDLPSYEFLNDKSVYLVMIHNHFTEANLLGSLMDYAQDCKTHLARRSKFNGHLVSEWTGLQGKELGTFMASFKQSHEEGFEDSYTVSEIEEMVLDTLEGYTVLK